MQINIFLTGVHHFGEGNDFKYPAGETYRTKTSDSDEVLSQRLALLKIRAWQDFVGQVDE